ncbi:MAG: polyprenol monophosphomannose synthase [Victivallales bacterium]|nr:polyprenol monophosphomannose synthase [Victivallales bacterium]
MSLKRTIVIPTYNEKENIGELLTRLEALFESSDYQIIVSDDDSPDGTWSVVDDFAERNSRISCLRRMNCVKGLSSSVVDAFDIAEGELLAVIDGDLQHDESFLPIMFAAAESADIVLGSRFAPGGEIEGEWPWHRRVFSACASLAAKLALGVSVSDPMSGYFVVRTEVYRKVRDDLNPKGFKILLEILHWSRLRIENARIAEVPIKFRRRTAGTSKLAAGVVWDYLASLAKMRFSGGK